jgi:hypothetical protein
MLAHEEGRPEHFVWSQQQRVDQKNALSNPSGEICNMIITLQI